MLMVTRFSSAEQMRRINQTNPQNISRIKNSISDASNSPLSISARIACLGAYPRAATYINVSKDCQIAFVAGQKMTRNQPPPAWS